MDGILFRLKMYLTRVEVFPGMDGWTFIPIALSLLAVIAAVACYGWSLYGRLRGPQGVDWDAEFGRSRSRRYRRFDPKNPFHRVFMALFSVFASSTGALAVWTRHFTSSSRGRVYHADGAPAVAAGAILCVAGVMAGAVALFGNTELFNRPLFGRKTSELPPDIDPGS